MSSRNSDYQNYRTISLVFLLVFVVFFLFAPAISVGAKGVSASFNGWTLFKVVLENIKDIGKAFDANFLVGIGNLLFIIIPAVAAFVLIRLLSGNVENKETVFSLAIMTGGLVVLGLIGIGKLKSEMGAAFNGMGIGEVGVGINLGIGLWGAAATAIAWYIYSVKNEPDEELEEEEDEYEEPVVRNSYKSQWKEDSYASTEIPHVYNPAAPKFAKPTVSEEVLKMIAGMSDTELQGVISYPKIYDAAFVEAARAELARRARATASKIGLNLKSKEDEM